MNNDLKKQNKDILEKIFNQNIEEIVVQLFYNEEELKSIQEEGYKKKLKEEIILYKNHSVEEIYEKYEGLNNISKENLNFLQINYILKKIIIKKNIYQQIPDNLIDEFVNTCYNKNKKNIYENAWKKQNSLWKFLNQQYNPKKIDFDNMQIDDINSLADNIKKR